MRADSGANPLTTLDTVKGFDTFADLAAPREQEMRFLTGKHIGQSENFRQTLYTAKHRVNALVSAETHSFLASGPSSQVQRVKPPSSSVRLLSWERERRSLVCHSTSQPAPLVCYSKTRAWTVNSSRPRSGFQGKHNRTSKEKRT